MEWKFIGARMITIITTTAIIIVIEALANVARAAIAVCVLKDVEDLFIDQVIIKIKGLLTVAAIKDRSETTQAITIMLTIVIFSMLKITAAAISLVIVL